MDDDERRKTAQLIREKASGSEKVDFLYKSSERDPEDYLLGKKINDLSELNERKKERPKNEAVGALFEDDDLAKRATLDMHAKMREDPLFAIKKKEEDVKKRLLQNPMKMKHLKERLDVIKGKSKKGKKKKKKHKKHSSDSDSENSGDELMKKYLAVLNKKHEKKSPAERSRSRSPKRRQKSESPVEQRVDRRRSRSPKFVRQNRSRSRSPYQKYNKGNNDDRYRDRSHSPMRFDNRRRSRSPQRREVRDRSRSPPVQKYKRRSRSPRDKKKGKMSEDEMERKRQEMLDNAKWRNEQRFKNVKQYKAEDAAEEQSRTDKDKKENFLNSMMSQHADTSSLTDRIKRNRNNLQRTNVDLDKNFAKR